MAGLWCWCAHVLMAMVVMTTGSLDVLQVELTGAGCPDMTERVLSDSEVLRLHASYDSSQQAVSMVCNITITAADNDRYLRYAVDKLSCGISIGIYDSPHHTYSNSPSRTVTCGGQLPLQGRSKQGVIKLSVHTDSTTLTSPPQLLVYVTTDRGPTSYVETAGVAYANRLTGDDSDPGGNPTPTNNNEGEGGGLNVGVVVGIAIAGIILIIALVGLAIYCCLRNRNAEMADVEASDGRSAPSVFTSGNSKVMFAGSKHQRNGGGSYGSMEDVRSSNSSTDRANNIFANKGYQADGDDDHRFDRQGSYRRERGGHKNAAFDESDHAVERGGHISRKDSGRAKYDKKKNFSRNEEYEMSKVSKVPNGILKTRSKSPNRSQSSTEGSTVDSNALVYGYSQTAHAHPNTQHIPTLERTRSRSRSRGASSHRSGSAGRSRSGSVGKSAGKDVKNTGRQYSDMSHFLEKPKSRPRSRSGSMGRRSRSDSRTSDNVPSEVSFAPSGASSKKNTGGRRVHIQGVETDF